MCCIERLQEFGTRLSSCKPVVLVTLGGCHLLDGLVLCLHFDARKKIVRCSREVIVRGIVLTPRESLRATLVERDAKSNKWSDRIMC